VFASNKNALQTKAISVALVIVLEITFSGSIERAGEGEGERGHWASEPRSGLEGESSTRA